MNKYIGFCNSVVLYWDLPDTYEVGNTYVITKGGEKIGETEQCHFKVNGLEANSEYCFAVSMYKDGIKVFDIGKMQCKTEPVKKRIDVTKEPYHALGDGQTLNTIALQKAIDDCGEGECVYVPAGDYMTGSLFLHSNMELYLDKDAIIHGTASYTDYEPKIMSRFEGHEMMTYAGLLNIGELDRDKGYTCENVRIFGEGKVYGGGVELAKSVIDREKILLKDYMESLGEKINECETSDTIPGRLRPRLINMSCAKDIVIAGIGIENGASWNVHMIYSDNVVTYDCTFRSEKVWNGDGWDPDSSTNCTIFGCEFFTGDDAVAIKAGKNPEGNVINRPCEHIRVFDCVSHFGHGITIGSEMSGGVRDIRIWNCDMRNSVYGIEIKGTKKRGGYVRDVYVGYSNVCRILMHSVSYNDDGEPAPTAPIFEDCTFDNMNVTAMFRDKDNTNIYCNPIEISGFDIPGHFIKNVKFKNITIDNGEKSVSQGIILQCCEGVTLENIYCR